MENDVAAVAVYLAAAGKDLAAVVDPAPVATVDSVAVDEHSHLLDVILVVLLDREQRDRPRLAVVSGAATNGAVAA